MLRYVLIISAAYLLIFEGELTLPMPLGVLIVGAFLSNVFLSRVPEKYLLRPFTSGAVIVSDITWISTGLWSKGSFGNDIFFIYFFVLFLAAVGQNLILIISASVVLSVIDLVLFVVPAGEGHSIWTSSSLIRVPFMFMAALFYGYLSEQVREEKKIADKRLKALEEIHVAITSTLDLRAVLDMLLERIDLFLPYAVTTVRLLNRKTGELEPVACRNLNEQNWKAETPRRFRVGKMLSAQNGHLDDHAPTVVRNAQTDPRSVDPEFLRNNGLVSYLRIPLIAKNELVGVLTFFTKEEREFSSDEVQFLTTLAAQAAVAIHNSCLYDEMKRLADELAASNHVKDEFLSVMSHELRTPLNIVLGYAGLLKQATLGEINLDQEKALSKILDQSQDLLAMMDAILYATSLNLQSANVENCPIDLTQFMDDLRSDCSVPMGKELALTWDYTSDLPSVTIDSGKLRVILTNLINNAIKFTDKGQVTLAARYFPEIKGLEFKVTDTGIGIPEESLSMIFEKFYQVDSSARRLYGGVGIGLYIVKKYAELLGGHVEVESKLGEGSVFSVRLPTEQSLSSAMA